MQGQRGASLATTRRIHRRMRREYERMLGLLAEKRKRPGYFEERCLTAETVRLLERQLSGESTPVGVLPGHWRTVCLENPLRTGGDPSGGPP